MLRVLGTADVHLGLVSYGRPVEEFGQTFAAFAATAIAEKVDVAIIAGDLFHSRRPGPLEILLAVKPIRAMTDAGIKVVIGPGNHDGMGTIAAPETHTLAWLAELAMPGVRVAVGPEIFNDGLASIAVLPYAHKRAVEQTSSLRERTAEASRILEATVRDMAAHQEGLPQPKLFVGHLTTIGASLGAEAAMQMGWDTTVDPHVFDSFDAAVLGHIHVGQQVGERAWYAGSPDVHAFGEKAEDKRFLLIEVEPGAAKMTPIPTHTRRVVRLRHATDDGGDSVQDAIVEYVLDEPVEPKVVEEAVRALKAEGAFFVRVKMPPRPRPQAPVLEDGVEPTDLEAVELWLKEQGYSDEERELAAAAAAEIVQSFRSDV